ncbi:MAG: mechanosensitive ion channel domain-containing protein [Desulfurococcaceae archaeon]
MASQQVQASKSEALKKASAAMGKTILYVVLYVIVAAAVQYVFASLLPSLGISVADYAPYAQILLALAFGYLIVTGISQFFYWTMMSKYDHPTAAAVRNVVKIIGIGAMIAAIAGGVAGGAAGVALGGFLGMVIGFASQQVLGQAIAGLFLLLARPFRIGDSVNVAGEDGNVEDVSTLFTTIIKQDGTKVLVPNNAIIGAKIYLKKKA